ncbi:hypothetical protein V6N13_100929 [Hibiscus sabdariffa]
MVKGKQPTTTFIHNLPEKMQWKGLWVTFAHHDEVIDAFIPRKRSENERKFGFVRYSSRVDAESVISRLNGFRISMSFAKFKIRTSFWRKVRSRGEGLRDMLMRRHFGNYIQVLLVNCSGKQFWKIDGSSLCLGVRRYQNKEIDRQSFLTGNGRQDFIQLVEGIWMGYLFRDFHRHTTLARVFQNS